MKYLRQCKWIFLLGIAITVNAQDTFDISSNIFIPQINEPVQSLDKHLLVQEDKEGKLQMAAFLNGKADTAFRRASSISNPDPFSIWWCKLTIDPSFSSNDFLIGIPFNASSGLDNGNDVAEIWIIKNNQINQHYHTGNLTPVSKRPVGSPINQNLFPIALTKGEAVSIYWRIQRAKYFAPPQFSYALQHQKIIKPSSFKTSGNDPAHTAMAYLGVMSILFIFGLVFFLITRQKPFIWFMLRLDVLACIFYFYTPEII